jgi:beta-glucosidase-like glycosyl hydrolase
MQGDGVATTWNATPGTAGGALLKTATTIKHFIAYDVECTSHGEDANMNEPFIYRLFSCDAPGVDRFHFEANISDADLSDYYLPPFERAMRSPDAKPASIMCSFPSINGVSSCANSLTQNTLARNTWGFDGFIATDCGGINFLNQGHYLSKLGRPEDAVAAGIRGGSDVECG